MTKKLSELLELVEWIQANTKADMQHIEAFLRNIDNVYDSSYSAQLSAVRDRIWLVVDDYDINLPEKLKGYLNTTYPIVETQSDRLA